MPTHLTRDKDRNYRLRRRMPDELRPIIGKREIGKSYGPVSFSEAKRRHANEVKLVADLFEQARRKRFRHGDRSKASPIALPSPSEVQMRAAIMDWFYRSERRAEDEFSQFAAEDQAEQALEKLFEDETHLSGFDGEIAAAAEDRTDIHERLSGRGWTSSSA